MAAIERLLLVLVMIVLAIEKKAVVAQANFTSGGYTTVYVKNTFLKQEHSLKYPFGNQNISPQIFP